MTIVHPTGPARHLITELRGLALLAGGRWGIVYRDLTTGEELALGADDVFPGASISKVGLLLEVLRQVDAGVLHLNDELTVEIEADEQARLGSGILMHLHRGLRVTLGDLCELAMNLSDNVASNLLIERVSLEAVNANLTALGCVSTRLNHRFEDFVALRSPEQNPVTAAELAGLLARLYRRELPGSDLALGYLRRCATHTRLPLYLPEAATTYHKTGTLRGIVHDGGIIQGPGGAFLLVCLSSHGENNIVASQAIAQMARAAWKAAGVAQAG